MSKKLNISRREILTKGTALAGGALSFLVGSNAIAASICKSTVEQGEGPFYPEADLDRDSDLTTLKPGMAPATGQVIWIKGKVIDSACVPVQDALVEVWQACHSGRYNHSGDTHNLPLDPNFQYWGRARTNANGEYLFKTIIPGHYPNGGGTFRPPHVHFKVHAAGFTSLTTQMYFNPDTYEDLKVKAIVEKWNAYERVPNSLKVLFKTGTNAGRKEGTFDITINSLS